MLSLSYFLNLKLCFLNCSNVSVLVINKSNDLYFCICFTKIIVNVFFTFIINLFYFQNKKLCLEIIILVKYVSNIIKLLVLNFLYKSMSVTQ